MTVFSLVDLTWYSKSNTSFSFFYRVHSILPRLKLLLVVFFGDWSPCL